jgi:hypothetical protein
VKISHWALALIAASYIVFAGSWAAAGDKGKDQVIFTQSRTVVVEPHPVAPTRPGGWNHGQKTGWHKKCTQAPPGLGKKGKIPDGLQKPR